MVSYSPQNSWIYFSWVQFIHTTICNLNNRMPLISYHLHTHIPAHATFYLNLFFYLFMQWTENIHLQNRKIWPPSTKLSDWSHCYQIELSFRTNFCSTGTLDSIQWSLTYIWRQCGTVWKKDILAHLAKAKRHSL